MLPRFFYIQKKIPRFLFFMLFFANSFATAQDGYRVRDFLDGYYLEGTTRDTTDYRADFYWELFSKNSGEKILETGDRDLKQKFRSLSRDQLHEISVKNIHLPFSDKEDFNFDGKPDLLIFDDHQSEEGCYHNGGTIYLSVQDQWVINEELSNLYSEAFCYRSGYFTVNPTDKTLITSDKYSYTEGIEEVYRWEKGKLKKIKTYISDYTDYPFYTETGKELLTTKWKDFTHRYVIEDSENSTVFLTFETENGKGRIIVMGVRNTLFYAFINPKSQVDFSYPVSWDKAEQQKFNLQQNFRSTTLSFSSGSVKYKIEEFPDSIGIRIFMNGNEYFWKGKAHTQKGSLQELKKEDFQNLL